MRKLRSGVEYLGATELLPQDWAPGHRRIGWRPATVRHDRPILRDLDAVNEDGRLPLAEVGDFALAVRVRLSQLVDPAPDRAAQRCVALHPASLARPRPTAVVVAEAVVVGSGVDIRRCAT